MASPAGVNSTPGLTPAIPQYAEKDLTPAYRAPSFTSSTSIPSREELRTLFLTHFGYQLCHNQILPYSIKPQQAGLLR